MKGKTFLTALILLQLIIFSGFAQNTELKFNLVEGIGGKPLGKITSITQDPHGYMWFSGQDERCLYRYDGVRLITFRHDDANPNSLGGNFINSVYADASGIIWIGLNEGLDRYEPENGIFKHFRHDPNDPSSISGNVTLVLRDRKGTLWVGTDEGLDRLDEKTGKFIHYRNEAGNPRSLSSNRVINIYEDRQGVIWIGTNFPWMGKPSDEGGLNRLDPDGSFSRFMHDPKNPHSLISNKVRAIFEDSRGIFWVGTSGDGLHTMDRTTGRFERHSFDPSKPDKLSRPPLRTEAWHKANDQVTFIMEDCVGSIWIGTMFSGINRYDTLTKKISHYEGSNGFPDSSGWYAYQSRDGVIWISTQENNLYRADPFHKTIHSITTSVPPLSFAEDKEENLWVGTDGGGLLQYDKQGKLLNQFKHDPLNSYSLFDSMNNVLSLFHDKGDTIWIGTHAGPGIFNKSTQRFSILPIKLKYNPELMARNVPRIIQDRQGSIWFVLNGNGLLRYHPGDRSFNQYLHDEKDSTSLTSDHIVSVFEDQSGKIWAGDYTGGINRLIPELGRFRRYNKGVPFHRLLQNSEGFIWAGTSNGLYRYNKNEDQFSGFFDPETEASTFKIISILEDGGKNLWMHTLSELIKLNPATKETRVYTGKFGIIPNSLVPLGFYKTRKGQFLLNHQKGFYAFYPEELAVSAQPLKIIITDIFINTIPLLPGKERLIRKTVEDLGDLVLQYNQNNLAFNFAAIDYRMPETIKYFTMLEGYDNTWREAKGEKSSYYFNLDRGKYVYRIKAYNSDGTKGEKVIIIHITPPWWKTWWAYAIYGLLLLAAIFTVYRYQKQRIISKERQKTQMKELAQAKEIEKAYTELKSTQAQLIQSEKMASLGELTAGIAHEIQNPLNFVNNFSEVNSELIDELEQEIDKGNLDDAKAIAKDIKENEEKINHHGKRADAIVKGMLQHSRSSSGIKEPTDINALADEYLRLAYHGLRAKDKSFNATTKTDFDETIGKINIIPQDIGRVILNLITNAFYAAPLPSEGEFKNPQNKHEPTVWVSTRKMGDKVFISVRDNGPGIPQKILDKIFQPFFTTKPTGQGTGLGLSLSYDIIKAHGGDIKVNTEENKGSEFIIFLPA